jgi:hypothetical protein
MDIYRDTERRGEYRMVYVWRKRLKPNKYKFCCSCARNVVKHLSHIKTAFCSVAKTIEVFLVYLSTFLW